MMKALSGQGDSVDTEAILQKFDQLIQEARAYSAGDRSTENDYFRIRTSAMNLIKRTCGDESDHYRALEDLMKREHGANPYYLKHCLGIIEAARGDFAGGFLFDLRTQVAAEMLGECLDQAQHLLEQGYHIAAASLTGAVLEDSLRKVAKAKGVGVPERTTIDGLNVLLAKGGAYALTVQKQVTALADIRNNADHGHFDQVKKADVEDMLRWVVRFNSEYLG